MILRDATHDDLPALLEIQNHAIRHLTAAWTETEETLAERSRWFEDRKAQNLPVIVAVDDDGHVLGFGSYGLFRTKPGYRFTAEHSVYVIAEAQGQGIGRALLAEIETRAAHNGIHVLVAVIDGENLASITLHERAGYSSAGRLPQVGAKFGRWLDLILMSKLLDERPAP